MTKWRKRIGEEGCEKLLELTIDAGKRTKVITERSVEKVFVGTTAQPKAVAHPTDARLCRQEHASMVRIAKIEALELRQSYTRMVKTTFQPHARYAEAKSLKEFPLVKGQACPQSAEVPEDPRWRGVARRGTQAR